VTGGSRYSRNNAVLAANLSLNAPNASGNDEEIALLGETREDYFGLNGTAAAIWRLLERPYSFDDLCAALLKTYDVNESELRSDVQGCLDEMLANRLVALSGDQ
jgi:hypothetical protein